MLGTDGSLGPGLVHWSDIFVPGTFEQSEATLKRCRGALDTKAQSFRTRSSCIHMEPLSAGPALIHQGQFSESETITREIEEKLGVLQENILPEQWVTMFNLASCSLRQEQYDDAAKKFGECLSIQMNVLGPDHLNTLRCVDELTWSRYQLWLESNVLQRLENTLTILLSKIGPSAT